MGEATSARSRTVIERTVREHWGYILATLVGFVRDLDLAEDMLQEAAVAALRHWPESGVPEHPRAWLIQAARRKAIDRFRRDERFRAQRDDLARWLTLERSEGVAATEEPVVDERLSLIFTCCHPALEEQARVVLTLRTLGGLTTTEIARAFLTPEATMAQRLVRAKRKISAANIPYRVPPPELWPERVVSVLWVVYFIFNEGYAATSGDGPTRADLCEEAIRLGRILVHLAPREPEAAGLLALMLLHDSRRAARTNHDGEYVALEHQDRSLWDRTRIDEGDRLLRAALARGKAGAYQLQAAISAVHAMAPSHAETDWRQIVGLYRMLHELQPSRVVRLNEAVALSFVDGPEAGLRTLNELSPAAELAHYQPFHAARADLLRRAGRKGEAIVAYDRALELTGTATERRFLERRRRELTDPG